MPGLFLGANGSATGSYTPLTPASASSPTAANNAQAAFGIGSIGTGGDGSTSAGVGAVSIGGLSLALLAFIWYSLPR